MANTSSLSKVIYPYVIEQLNRKLGLNLAEEKQKIGNPGKSKKFDGVSQDGKTIVTIFTSVGFTRSGKTPVGKLNSLYANCYMLNLTKAERKILAFTSEEFMNIVNDKCSNFLEGFELMYVPLTEGLRVLSEQVSKAASDELTN